MADANPRHSINIRNAHPEDIRPVAELGAFVFASTFGHSVAPHELQAYLNEFYSVAAITRDMEDPMKDMIIATSEDGAVVGFALLTRGSTEPCIEHLDNTIELQRIYVHPDYHGNGIGKLLAKRLEDTARAQGFQHMWLGVWEENHNAQRVYEKLGYKPVGEHGFNIGEVIQIDHIMVKAL